jgi:hypothetical protein
MVDVTAIIQQVWFFILNIGSLGFLGIAGPSVVLAFTRILIWVFIFAVLYALSSSLLSGFLKRPQAIIISGIMATISAIFLPDAVLAATGAGWATAVGLFLIGAPIVSLALLLHYLPKEPCFWNFVKALLALLILWIVNAMEFHLKSFGKYALSASLQQFLDWSWWIALIVSIYYLLRMLSCWMSKTDQGDPSKFWRFIDRVLQPFRQGGGNDDTPPHDRNTIDFSLPPPPGGGPPGPSDPPFTPSDFKPGIPDTPRPGPPIPPYHPSGPKPPKDKRIFVDLSPWFLNIRSQGHSSACAAFSGASIVEYVFNRRHGKKWKYLSPLFLWYYSRGSRVRDSGCYLHDVTQNLLNAGDCFEDLWSFEDTRTGKYLQVPPDVCATDAAEKKISEVRSLSSRDPDQWIQALIEENPIYFGMPVTNNFCSFKGSFYNLTPDHNPGGHAMVIVGYDSHYKHGGNTLEAFKIRNSWGTSWGDHGYVWISRDLLSRILSSRVGDPPMVLTGWQEFLPKTECRIVGKAVFEDHNDGTLDETGKKIYDYSPHGVNHKFKVGVIAQINGGLRPLREEMTVNNPQGRFSLKFEAYLSRFEHLTELPKEYPQLKGIDFKKLPKGVVVYKKGLDDDDKYVYFHIVDFKHSHRGRGGEGKEHPENPCSAVRSGMKFSGVPIKFSKDHTDEKNVVIPAYRVYTTPDDVSEVVEKLREAAKKEKVWVDRESKLLEEIKKNIHPSAATTTHKIISTPDLDAVVTNLEDTKKHLSEAGKIEIEIRLFKEKAAHELNALILNLPEEERGNYLGLLNHLAELAEELFRKTAGGETSLKSLLNNVLIRHPEVMKSDSLEKRQEEWRKLNKFITNLDSVVDVLKLKIDEFSLKLEKLIVS